MEGDPVLEDPQLDVPHEGMTTGSRLPQACGRTLPDAIMKAFAWVDKVAEFPEEQRVAHSKIVVLLSDGPPIPSTCWWDWSG